MKNKELRFITEIGIFTALGLVLDYAAGWYSNFIFPSGGSISIAMVPIFIIAFRWGLKGGLTVGFLIGAIQVIYSEVFGWGLSSLVLVAVIFFDYVFAYTVCGLAGVFAKKAKGLDNMPGKLNFVTYGILLATSIRSIFHITSGWLFFRAWIPEFFLENSDYVWWYWSIIYNLGYMVPSAILCILIMHAIFSRFHKRLLDVDSFMFG